jgi:hypothetical protein
MHLSTAHKKYPQKVGRPSNATDPTVSVGLDSNGNPIIDIGPPDSSIPPNKRKKNNKYFSTGSYMSH